MKKRFLPLVFRFAILLVIGLWMGDCVKAQVITTIAGNGTAGYSGDGGAATAAQIRPWGMAVDGSGNVYIADEYNYCIRKVTPSGTISTIAGNGTAGYSGDGGAATAAELNRPIGLAVDGSGNMYIADFENHCIRKVTSSGAISTIAGNGTGGYSGDGGAAIAAKLQYPIGVAFDTSGNLYIGDCANNRIRKVTPSGTISTFAGNGTYGYSGDGGAATGAELKNPYGVAVDGSGNILIADEANHCIRKVTPSGIITTIAGSGTSGYSGDGGAATTAELAFPCGIAVDHSGNVYIADYSNNRIRKVTTSGAISTITGNGTGGYSGDGGPATAAALYGPFNVSVDGSGNVYIADESNHRIRRVGSCPLPYVSAITGSALLCVSSSITLTDATAGGAWSSSSSSIATVNSTTGFVTGVASGSVTIAYILTNSCGSDTATHTVTVNPLPNARSITGASVVCAGSAITLVDTASGGTWSSGTTSVATISSGGIVTGVSAGATTISYSVTNSCGTVVATHAVTVNPLPRAGTITGASVVCAGSTITLADTASGGTWSTSSASFSTISSGGVVTGISVGTVIVSYTVTDSCGTAVDTMIITVNPMPNSGSISGVTSLCVGASAIILTETVTGGAWSSGSTSLATVSSSGVVTPIAAGVVTISYSVTNSCGTAVSIHNITITGPPAVSSITGAATLCLGDTTLLTDGTAGGVWSSGTASIATVNSYGRVTAVSTGTVIISYTVTNSCGSTAATRTLTVSAAPAVLPIAGPAALCIGSVIVLTDSSSGGVWSSGSTGIATVNSFGVVTGVAAGTDTVRYTITTGCGSASAVYVLTIFAAPSTAVITGASAICPGDSTAFTASLAGGSWTSGSATIATVNLLGEVYSVAAGAATISYTISNICGSSYGVQTITVNPLPFASAISGTDSLCPGLTSTFTDATVGGAWVSSNPSIATVDGSGVVSSLTAGTVNILYVVTNSCGSDTAVFPFVVKGMVDCPDAVAGIEHEGGSSLKIYPNPNDGNFIISGNINASGELTFEVRDVVGRVVKTGTGAVINGKFELAVQLDRALNDGYYYVRIFASGVVLAGSFVVGR